MYQIVRKYNLICKISLTVITPLLFSVAQSHAADIIPSANIVTPYENLGYSWTGLYFGGQAGYGLGKSGATYIDNYYHIEYPFSSNISGFKGGIYAGYNFTLTDDTIFSIETDLMLSDIGGNKGEDIFLKDDNGNDALNHVNYTTREKWSGATRARLGFANGRYLPYIAGGLAYASVKTYTQSSNATQSFDFATDNMMMGWTVGGGLDYAWNDHFVLRLEYRYNDYGDTSQPMPDGDYKDGFKTSFTSNEVRLGVGYKF